VSPALWFLSYVIIGFFALMMALGTFVILEAIYAYYRDRFK
jgi:hypothetical protein